VDAHASYAKAAESATRNGDERLAIFAANRDRAAAAVEKQQQPK